MKKLRRLEPILYFKAKEHKRYDTHTIIKWLNKYPIRYYMAGEYGDKSDRPHYHAIMFNIQDVDNIAKAWSRDTHNGEVLVPCTTRPSATTSQRSDQPRPVTAAE